MSLTFSNNKVLQQIVDLLESLSATEQKRMLYVLKLEQARKKITRAKLKSPRIKTTDTAITKMVEGIRAGER